VKGTRIFSSGTNLSIITKPQTRSDLSDRRQEDGIHISVKCLYGNSDDYIVSSCQNRQFNLRSKSNTKYWGVVTLCVPKIDQVKHGKAIG